MYTLCTIIEFEFTDYPYTQRGIEIIAKETIKIFNNDYSEFCAKYDLVSISYNYGGENLFENKNNFPPNVYYIDGLYKDIITLKYYILSFVDIE